VVIHKMKPLCKSKKIVLTEEDLSQAVEALSQSDIISFDVETSGVDILTLDWYAIGIFDGEIPYYIPLRQKQKKIEEGQLFAIQDSRGNNYLKIDTIVKALNPVFDNEKITKIGHNIKFDIRVVQKYGLNVKGHLCDTKIAAWMLDENRSTILKDLGVDVLGKKVVKFENLIERGRDFLDVPLNDAADYSAQDVVLPWELTCLLLKQLKKENLLNHFLKVEMPFLWVLIDMENNGFYIDIDGLMKYGKVIATEKKKAAELCYKVAGENFNINSSQQLSDILFNKMGYKPIRMTKSEKPSTAADVMEELAKKGCKLADSVLYYRKYEKLGSTYIDAMPGHLGKDGRIHCKYHPTGTVTGRLSSSTPNMQNLPSHGEVGAEIRRYFKVFPGKKLIVADYSQVELRIMAHFSQDTNLLDAYRNEIDVHVRTAALVYGVPEEKVTKLQRMRAKSMNFGLIYGMSSVGFAKYAGIDEKSADKFRKKYFHSYAGVARFIEEVHRKVKARKFVNTISGRKRRLPEAASKDRSIVNYANRQAVNARVQGTAADIIKWAMVKIREELPDDCKVLAQIHDEAIYEVPEGKAEEYAKKIKEIMESSFIENLTVPLIADVCICDNWLEGK
jgi:DNA polymerase I